MALLRRIFVPSQIFSESISKFMIVKNFIIICLIYFFCMAALISITIIESTVNHEGGIGVASSAVAFTANGLALVIPLIFIKKIKFKWTLTVGLALQIFFVAFNAYPKWYLLLPGLYQI